MSQSLPRVMCPRCQVEVGHWTVHRRGVMHRRIRKIRVLLDQDSLSFSVIAKRLGITTQRVAQIATTLGYRPGRSRQAARRNSKIQTILPAHLKRILHHARRAGINACVITKNGRLRKTVVSIEGQTVRIFRLIYNKRIRAYRIRQHNWRGAKFAIFYAENLKEMLVVPEEGMRSTALVLGRPRQEGCSPSQMYRYVDAWNLLAKSAPSSIPPQTCSSHPGPASRSGRKEITNQP